jgi:hypothetical protein
MASEQDLIALLHRADWTRLCLSGEVRGVDEDAEHGLTLLVAPGKRFREELPGRRQVRGCDGETIWLWDADEPAGPGARLIGGPQPPFPTLLAPSWLLDRYELTIEGDTTACGRAAIRVAATRRFLLDSRGPIGRPFGLVPVAPRHASSAFQYDNVSAIVDAELGILLGCETREGDDAPELTEFVSLTMDPDTDPAVFTAPPGSVTGGPMADRPFGLEVAKTAAGLTAGGLGAVIRYAPFGRARVDPFGRATSEDDPEPEMPPDEGFPGHIPAAASPAAPVSDQVLQLIYRAGGDDPELTCTLHQWLDVSALLSAVPESVRRTGFGGVGLLVDALVESSRSAGKSVTHEVRSVSMGGWDKYRIDRVYPPPPRGRAQPNGAPESDDPGDIGSDERLGLRARKRRDLLTVACDGQQRWQVYPDRVVLGPAGPPQDELVDLLDGSWLLASDLSGEEEITVGGRRAYRFAVDARPALREPFALLAKLVFPALAVVDAETGLLLRVTTYKGGKPVARHELRDIEPAGRGGDFGFNVPAGIPVVEESEEDKRPRHAEWGRQGATPVDAAKAAARELFDSFRGGKPRRW